MNTLDEFLSNHSSNRYQVYQLTGLAQTTLKSTSERSLENWTLRTLFKIAEAVSMKPEEVLRELIKIERRG